MEQIPFTTMIPGFIALVAAGMAPVLLSAQVRELLGELPTDRLVSQYLIGAAGLGIVHLAIFLAGSLALFSEGIALLKYAAVTNMLAPTVAGLGAYQLGKKHGIDQERMQAPLLIAGAWYVLITSIGLVVAMIGLMAFFFPG
jgi:hypothetical protein